MPKPKFYTCPVCRCRAQVVVLEGQWYWASHATQAGKTCPNSGKQL